MSIATEKLENASERFILARLEPARYVLPTSQGGGLYGLSFPYQVSRIQRNGVNLTKVTSISNNDEYTYNETTGAIVIKLASSPNDSTNVIVVFYYLFYTGTISRAAPETPTNTATAIRFWEPRILEYPSFVQSFKNISSGVFTIADSQLVLANADQTFQSYLTDDDSFYNKEVAIWLCINSTSNVQRAFIGYCTSIKWNKQEVKIDIADSFSKLKNVAYMGDTASECILTIDDYPDLDPKANGKPVPYIFGESSYYKSVEVYQGRFIIKGTEAYCTDYDPETTIHTNNRNWTLCRGNEVPANQSFGTFISSTTEVLGVSSATFTSFSNIYVGDTFSWNKSGTDYYTTITDVVGNKIYFSYESITPITVASGSTFYTNPAMCIILENPNNPPGLFSQIAYPQYGRDYTLNSTLTSGNNRLMTITSSNFESQINFGTFLDDLDPATMRVYFKVLQSDPGMSVLFRRMLTKAGFTSINATSFGLWDDLLTLRTKFQIPNIDEEGFDNYLKYVEDFLSGALCYIFIDTNFQVKAGILSIPFSPGYENPATEDDTRSNKLIIADSISGSFDYQDIATQIIPYNPHVDDLDAGSNEFSLSNNKAKYLHGIVNTNRFKHPFQSISQRIDAHIGLKSNRASLYTYEVATEDIDSVLGDNIHIENTSLPYGEKDVRITSIEKSPGRISVEATDLLGITDAGS